MTKDKIDQPEKSTDTPLANQDRKALLEAARRNSSARSIAKQTRLAKQEMAKLSHDHNMANKKLSHKLFKSGLLILFWSICLVFVIRLYHFVTPFSWWFLEASQLEFIDTRAISLVIGALGGKFMDKLITFIDK